MNKPALHLQRVNVVACTLSFWKCHCQSQSVWSSCSVHLEWHLFTQDLHD